MLIRAQKNFCPAKSLGKDMEVDESKREIQGYFATWDLDRIGDTIDKKAFVKTLKERGPRYEGENFLGSDIKIDFNHHKVVGVPLEMGYDDTGAWYKARLDPTEDGETVLKRVQNKSLDVNSFVFDIMDFDPVKNGESQVIQGGYEVQHRRHLKELRVHFVGPVDGACNEAARIGMIGVKNIGNLSRQDLGTWLDELVWNYSQDIKAGRQFSEGDLMLLDAVISRLTELRQRAGEPDEDESEPEMEPEEESMEEEEPKSEPPPPDGDSSEEAEKALMEDMDAFIEQLKGMRNG